jgi:PAS domain S-box-containing protein
MGKLDMTPGERERTYPGRAELSDTGMRTADRNSYDLGSNPEEPWRGRPWVYLTIGLAVTFAVWWLTANERRNSTERMTRIAAAGIANDIKSDIRSRTQSLEYLAELWGNGPLPSNAEWESEVRRQFGSFPGFKAFEWVDRSLRVRRTFPARAGNIRTTPDPDFLEKRRAAIESARQERGWTFSPSLELPGGGRGFLFCAPAYQGELLRGFIVTVLSHREFWEDVYQDHAGQGFVTTIFEGNEQVFHSPGGGEEYVRGKLQQDAEIRFPGAAWQVRLNPGPELLAEMKRGWNESTVLLMGIVLSLLLKITSSRSQTAIRLANKTRLANLQLEKEIAARKRTEATLLASRTRLALIMNIAAEGVISTNESQEITLFNRGAEEMFGYGTDEVLGKPLEMLIPERHRAGHRRHFQEFGSSSEATRLMGTSQPILGLRKDGEEFPAQGSISKLALQDGKVFTVMLRDVSEARRAEEALRKAHDELEERVQERTAELAEANERLRAENAERRQAEELSEQLSEHLLSLQDEERRRIARELHDSTAQSLAAATIAINMAQAESSGLSAAARDALASGAASLDECLHEIRNLSYLLHPPLLEGMGLVVALGSLAEGFSKRSGIRVDLVVPPDFGRLPEEVELAFFRIVQESLTNVYRYSGSPSATVRLSAPGNEVTLEIADQGRGIPPDIMEPGGGAHGLGVGIAGMRARMRQLGGQLVIETASTGTTVKASLTRAGKDS